MWLKRTGKEWTPDSYLATKQKSLLPRRCTPLILQTYFRLTTDYDGLTKSVWNIQNEYLNQRCICGFRKECTWLIIFTINSQRQKFFQFILGLLGYDTIWTVTWGPMLQWNIMLPASALSNVIIHKPFWNRLHSNYSSK